MDPGNSASLRPYVKYMSNGTDRVYFISTQSHPRESNTGIYAGYITPVDGNIHQINSAIVGTLGTNTGTAVSVTSLSTIFAAQPEGVIGNRTHFWTTDLSLDSAGNPYALFTSRTETDTNTSTADTTDHRFYYARWNGSSFTTHEIAKAGGFLYSSEEDYTGLGALSPSDPNTLYISTKIDPRDGANTSKYEIYRGFTSDDGTNWTWIPITTGSTSDNLRPVVPKWDSTHTALLWFQGTYTTYQHANAAVVGKFYTGNNGLWKNSTGGAWETATNWRDQQPADGMSFIADFSTLDIFGNVNVTQGGERSLGFLTFGDSNPGTVGSWTLAGGTLVLDGGVIAPIIQVKNQTATIGSTISGSHGLTKTGAGVLRLTGDNDYTGPTTVQAGTLVSRRFVNTALAINAGSAQVIAGASPNSADGMSIVPSLSIALGAQLDLTNNSLAIDYTTLGTLLTDVRNHLLSGRLTTSLSAGGFALGYADGIGPDQTSLTVRYVYRGDINLDGTVNALDFNVLASNFGDPSGQFWIDGDVNYDGAVNSLDFDALAMNFNRSIAPPLGTFVPEPAGILLLSAAVFTRHRRNKKATETQRPQRKCRDEKSIL
jgi:autotransporter-associated beta strand protein